MSIELWHTVLYGLPIAAAVLLYGRHQRRVQAAHRATLEEAVSAGLTEPVSLHPVIDPLRCLGSGTCVSACPEQALGIIDGKAQLVNPTVCIGHGACAATCPFEAISLVFGTEKRGVDIPEVTPAFETNIPGLFIAGELGGMGLIRKAVEQGRQAVDNISRKPRARADLDVLIIGAGPAGLSASLAAKERGLRYLTLEQEDALGGSILHYPRAKIAMTAPMQLPLIGRVNWQEISKEALLKFWNGVVEKSALDIRFGERMETVGRDAARFSVVTTRGRYTANNVLLSIGRRGTPRKLDVPGEELPKVVYRLMDSGQYRNQRVLVVGGGDSAIEAALALAAEGGTAVTLSYRGAAFSRVKPKNRVALEQAIQGRKLSVLMESGVTRIEPDRVVLCQSDRDQVLRNDAVIVCAGGVLPTGLLKEIGVRVSTHYGHRTGDH
jgi:thioredoxin reductase